MSATGKRDFTQGVVFSAPGSLADGLLGGDTISRDRQSLETELSMERD